MSAEVVQTGDKLVISSFRSTIQLKRLTNESTRWLRRPLICWQVKWDDAFATSPCLPVIPQQAAIKDTLVPSRRNGLRWVKTPDQENPRLCQQLTGSSIQTSETRHNFSPCKANAFTLTRRIPQYACRDDLSILCQQIIYIILLEAERQVGNVQVCRILLLLLHNTKSISRILTHIN